MSHRIIREALARFVPDYQMTLQRAMKRAIDEMMTYNSGVKIRNIRVHRDMPIVSRYSEDADLFRVPLECTVTFTTYDAPPGGWHPGMPWEVYVASHHAFKGHILYKGIVSYIKMEQGEYTITMKDCETIGCQTFDYYSQQEMTMAPKNVKIPKFYVASTAISRSLVPGGVNESTGQIVRPSNLSTDYVKHTEKEAVDLARQLVEKDGETRYIVKIVKVVRRKPQPVVVETVK